MDIITLVILNVNLNHTQHTTIIQLLLQVLKKIKTTNFSITEKLLQSNNSSNKVKENLKAFP